MRGWLSIERALFKHDIVGITKHNGVENYSRFVFWIWLLANANYEDAILHLDTQELHIKRGQYYGSIRFISDKIGASVKSIRNSLEVFKRGKLIDVSKLNGQTLITICKYNDYQRADEDKYNDLNEEKGKPRANVGQTLGKRCATKYNNTNNTNNNITPDIEKEFNEFWEIYGKVGDRKPSLAKYKIVRRKADQATLIEGNKKYDAHLKEQNSEKHWLNKKGLSVWLNAEGWNAEYKTDRSSGGYKKTVTPEMTGDRWKQILDKFFTDGIWDKERHGHHPKTARFNPPPEIKTYYQDNKPKF